MPISSRYGHFNLESGFRGDKIPVPVLFQESSRTPYINIHSRPIFKLVGIFQEQNKLV